jgi:hypothetical protein
MTMVQDKLVQKMKWGRSKELRKRQTMLRVKLVQLRQVEYKPAQQTQWEQRALTNLQAVLKMEPELQQKLV